MSTRRNFLKLVAGSGAAFGLSQIPFLSGCGMHSEARQPLRLPAPFSGGTMTASVGPAGTGAAPLLTYGGAAPSPTIRVRSGEMFSVMLNNQLGEATNIHWHGLVTPADMDGHPKDAVAAGGTRTFSYQVKQRAGTYWYHPHAHMATGKQVYHGMAGFFLVEDAEEQALSLPRGEFDVPLLIQDRRVMDGQIMPYEPTMTDMADGFLGDTVQINGVLNPFFEVAAGLYRLRLLNGANARIFRLAFEDMRSFAVIATDGGLLEAPIQATAIYLGPGERAEILVDFSADAMNSSVMFMSLEFGMPAPSGGGHGGHGGGSSSIPRNGAAMEVLRFDVKRAAPAKGTVPTKLATLTKLDPAQAARTRTFELAMRTGVTSGMHTLNNKVFDMVRVDETVPFGATEIWEFKSLDDASIHPMHLHGAQFQVLSRSGGPLSPTDQGWKDTVLVFPMETVRVIVRFDGYRGLYLVHCHTLEHEDDGMMLNFQVM